MNIAERLRDPNKWAGTSDSDHNPLPSHAMALEAANKIEGLQKALKKILSVQPIKGDEGSAHITSLAKALLEINSIAEAALKGDE